MGSLHKYLDRSTQHGEVVICGKPFSEAFEFVRVYTDRYAEVVVAELIHSDTANVARQHGLSEDVVWSMVEYINEKKSVLT